MKIKYLLILIGLLIGSKIKAGGQYTGQTSYTLTIDTAIATNIQWYKSAANGTMTAISGASQLTYSASQTGVYYATYDLPSCTNQVSKVAYLTFDISKVTIDGGTNNTGSTFIWSYNASPIAGQTSSTLQPTQYGEYTVNTDGKTCNQFSPFAVYQLACTAGTTAPAITPTMASNTCPTATVDLSTLANTGTTPTGTTLIWSTHNIPTTAGDTLTSLSVSIAGKYYALYYDKVSNCYSPADSVVVTINVCNSGPCPLGSFSETQYAATSAGGWGGATSAAGAPDGNYHTAIYFAGYETRLTYNTAFVPGSDIVYSAKLNSGVGSGGLYFEFSSDNANWTSPTALLPASGITSTLTDYTYTIPTGLTDPSGSSEFKYIRISTNSIIEIDAVQAVNYFCKQLIPIVYLDNGAGGGTAGNCVKDGTETITASSGLYYNLVQNLNVKYSYPVSDGVYFSKIPDGNYSLVVTNSPTAIIPIAPGYTITNTTTNISVVNGVFTPSTLTNCIKANDTDGDGISDITDLDDDNDGILDTIECPALLETPIVTNGSFEAGFTGWSNVSNFWSVLPNPTGLDIAYNANDAASNNIFNQTIDLSQALVVSGYYTFNFKTFTNGAGNAIINSLTADLKISYNNTLFATISNPSGSPTATVTPSNGALVNISTFPIIDPSLSSELTDLNLKIPVSSVPVTGVLEFSFDANGDDIGITGISVDKIPLDNPNLCDTDGDGIANYLDLDSDGDGCPDALEGGANLAATSLVTSSIAGGNSGAGYTGTSTSPVVKNLGNTVNANGIPTIAGTGQTIGNSANKLVQSANCGTCNAGTTVPSVSGTTLSNICPLATANLNSLVTSTAPSGASLVWFTNNAHTGTAYATPTTAVAGTYYAFYFDATNNCYSPATSGVVVTINACNDAPVITSSTTVNYAENGTTPAYTTTTTDPNAGQTKTFSFETGGVDNALFTINPTTGEVSFNTSPNFESPTDAGGNNIYDIKVKVCDNGSPVMCDTIDVAITVTDVVECLAGTTAPSVSATTLSNTCPATTANLSSLVTSTAPSGASLVWFTNNAHTGTAYSTPTTAVAGTYYAFYFDATNNCYSPATSAVTVTMTTCSNNDNDGDGVNNDVDLDDDNDGILDTNEGFCQYSGTPYTLSNLSNSYIYTDNMNWAASTTDAYTNITKPQFGLPDNTNLGKLLYENTTGLYSGQVNFTNGPIVNPVMEYRNIDFSKISFFDINNNPVTLTPVWVNAQTTIVNGNTIQETNAAIFYAGIGGTTCFDCSADGYVKIMGTFSSIKYSGDQNPASYGSVVGGPWRDGFFLKFYTTCTSTDTDGDGIANYLDLDSDGDGCPDALEGGANLAATSLVTSSIAGGNSGAGYTGTSTSPVVKNLGNTVNANGIPTIAGTGQTVGNSANKLVQSPNCATCVAGTTAPIITQTTASNTCPVTTADLSTMTNTGTKPTGTTLIWSTHNTPSVASDTLTSLSVTAGKYYALYYDTLSKCYSPADSVTVTITACCATPSVGGTATYTGGAVCSTANMGTITLTGKTGDVIKWQTSTNGGTSWTDITNTAYKNSYTFINAVNNQQYRAIINTGGVSCVDAASTVVTIVTTGACTTNTCSYTSGTFSPTISTSSNANYTTHVILVNPTDGLIKYVTTANSTAFTGVALGDYIMYAVTYDNTLAPQPTFTVGANISTLDGCLAVSDPLLIKVCCPTIAAPITAVTQPTCSVATGTITVAPISGVTYSFDNGTTYQASNVKSGLTASTTYQVVVKDNTSGCVSTAAPSVINAQPASPTIINITQANPSVFSCPTVNDGSITITATGSNLEYSKDNGVTWQASNVFSGLVAGNYNLKVRDAGSGCAVGYAGNPVLMTAPFCNAYPVITSGITATTPENVSTTMAVYTVTATDPNVGQTQTFSFETGGVDNALFTINPTTGVVTFNTSPDFENPTDANGDNVYMIKIKVCDNGTPVLCTAQNVAITVTDVVETEICNNLIDDDGDGKIDCEDSDCTPCSCTTISNITYDAPTTNPSASHTRRYVLTNDNGVIQKVSTSPIFIGCPDGQYRVYTVWYIMATYTPPLSIGSNISAVTGTSVVVSLPKLEKVCSPTVQYETRILEKAYDCINKKVTIQVQVRTKPNTGTFLMGDANYRFDYNSTQLTNPVIVSQEHFSNVAPSSDVNYVPQSLNGSSEGPTIGTVSLNTVYGGGGLAARTVDSVWQTVSCIQFTKRDTALCYSFRWHDNLENPSTGMTGIVLNGGGAYDVYDVKSGGYYGNYQQCLNTLACCTTLDIKVILEGPYSSTTGLMSTVLNQRGLLPGQTPIGQFGLKTPDGQPFNANPWNYTGTETLTNYPATVVDWVLVSLRTDSLLATSTVLQKAGLLHSDGHVSFLDSCWVLATGQKYFAVVEHRNHIGVMSNVAFTSQNNIVIDFTAGDGYIRTNPPTTGQKQVGSKWVMLTGDGRKDTPTTNFDVNFNDSQRWKTESGIFDQYINSDFNLDADANFLDSNLWKKNNGRYSGVPH